MSTRDFLHWQVLIFYSGYLPLILYLGAIQLSENACTVGTLTR